MQTAFFYSDEGGMQPVAVDIGGTAWTGPVAMNSSGATLIQAMDTDNYQPLAYYATVDGGTFNLADLVVNEPDLIMDAVEDINEAGQIVGEAIGPNFYRYGVLLTPVQTGDVNCDGAVNNFDIDAFVLALTNPAGYEAVYPTCARSLADADGSGTVDNFDIDPFVDLLTN